jgi:non-canonical purine NTP pyrophosphatase (RdgB/HAM1 family)
VANRRKVVLASRNRDKLGELAELMAGLPFEVVSALDYPGLPDVIEDGVTIMGNAVRKALLAAAWTGEIALADDTSLQVRELNGWPDIFAARFSGPEATYASNAALLLDLMRDVPDGSRQARFATACAWIDPRPGPGAFPVAAPATRRWLHNPWARAVELRDPVGSAGFWEDLGVGTEPWATYAVERSADLANWGHDAVHLREVAAMLLGSGPGGFSGDGASSAVRLPDPTLWATPSREHAGPPPTVVAPTGLPREAPGRERHASLWLEIGTEGRLLGDITRQPLGSAGFGYDPVFRPAGLALTLAELAGGQKHAISHRGRALARMRRAISAAYGPGVGSYASGDGSGHPAATGSKAAVAGRRHRGD